MIDPQKESEKILSKTFVWNIEAFNYAADKMKRGAEGDEWQKVFKDISDRWGNRLCHGEDDYNLIMTVAQYAEGFRDQTIEELEEEERKIKEWEKENPNWETLDDTEEDDLPF